MREQSWGFGSSPDRDEYEAESPAQSLPGLEIGSAGWRDLLAIAGVQRRAFPPRFAYSLSTLAILWALPWVQLLVARRDGAIVGCVIADRVLEGNRIVNLAVDPAAQRQGIGTALLHAAERALPGGDHDRSWCRAATPPRARSTVAWVMRRSPSILTTMVPTAPASRCGRRGAEGEGRGWRFAQGGVAFGSGGGGGLSEGGSAIGQLWWVMGDR